MPAPTSNAYGTYKDGGFLLLHSFQAAQKSESQLGTDREAFPALPKKSKRFLRMISVCFLAKFDICKICGMENCWDIMRVFFILYA